MKVIMMAQSKNHFSEQERFVWMEITFTLKKNRVYSTSGLGGRSFPVVKLDDRQAGENLIKKNFKLCNLPFNLFFECLNRFLTLLTLYQ